VDAAGRWRFEARLRSHYHVFCSDKANRAGFRRQDSAGLKFWLKTLPAELLGVVERTQPGDGPASR
jgi:hypothetical protein